MTRSLRDRVVVNFAAHLIQNRHTLNEEIGVNFLHVREKGRVLDRLKEIEIAKYRNNHLTNEVIGINSDIQTLIKACKIMQD